MKTIRTIIGTLSGVLLAFALMAWFSVRRNAAFLQRTIYQGFDQTFVVALVMGCAFLLISIILTVAIVSTENDEDEDEEDEEEPVQLRRRPQPAAERRPAAPRGEQPYRRVSRTRTMDRPEEDRESEFARPKAKAAEERPKPKKRERAAESPDEITFRREEAPVKKAKKVVRPQEEIEKTAVEPEAEDEAVRIDPPQPAAAAAEREPREVPSAPEAAVGPEPAEEPAETQAPAEESMSVPEAADRPDDGEALAAEPEEAMIAEPEEAVAAEPEEAVDERREAEEPAPASEPVAPKEDMVIRCVFCGSGVLRSAKTCPHCGKKM